MSTPLDAAFDTMADRFEATIQSARAAEMCDSELAAALVVDVVTWVADNRGPR